jgi:hypothetical protein
MRGSRVPSTAEFTALAAILDICGTANSLETRAMGNSLVLAAEDLYLEARREIFRTMLTADKTPAAQKAVAITRSMP